MEWSIFTRDQFGNATGGIPVIDAEAVVRRITTGVFVVETHYSPARWQRLPPAAGLIIRRDGRTICSGVWTRRSHRTGLGDDYPLGLMSLEGVTDDVIGEYRLCAPNPALALDGQNAPGAAAVWSMTGPVETLMHAIVNQNAGPGARPERRVPALVMGVDRGRGPTVSWQTLRYPTVQDELRRMAATAERAGVRLLPVFHQTELGLTFEVLEADDRTGLVVFGAGLGNLDEQEYVEEAGTAGLAVAGGKGEGAARIQDVAVAADAFTLAFGVLPEVYIDRRETDDVGELAKASQDAIDDGVAKVSWRGVALDTDGTRYGHDFDLNSLATVKVGPSGTDPLTGLPLLDPDTGQPLPAPLPALAEFDDLVRELHFKCNPADGTDVVTAAVGQEGAATGVELPSLSKIAALNAQVTQLQRSP